MRLFSITGNHILNEEVKDGTYKFYIVFLLDDCKVNLYSSFNLIQLISVLTEKDYNIVCNETGQKEIISRKHIIKIVEVK